MTDEPSVDASMGVVGEPVVREPVLAPAALTRVFELLAEACAVGLTPRQAWDAAADAASVGGDALAEVQAGARRGGLAVGRSRVDWHADPRALDELPTPALTWLEGEAEGEGDGRGCALLLLGRRGRAVDLVLIDGSGERHRSMGPQALRDWLGRQADGAGARWLCFEPLLPLAAVQRQPQASPRLGPVRRLLTLAALDRSDIAVILVYAAVIGAMTLAVPVAVQALVNTVAFGTVLQPLVVLSLLLATVLGFMAILRVLQVVVVEVVQRRLFVRVATDFARRLPRLSAQARATYHGPELANRFFEVLTLQKAAASLLTDGLALLLQLLVGMLLLAVYHPVLLAFDLFLLLAVLAVITVAGRGAVGTSLAESSRKYAVAAWLEDVAGSPLRFGEGSARAFADARGELLIREWLQARAAHFRRLLRQHIGGLSLQVVASTALLGIGGWLVIRRQLTLGQLVAAELVVTAIGVGLGKLGKQLESVYDATTAAEKLGKVLDLPLEAGGGQRLGGSGPLAVALQGSLTLAAGARRVLAGRGLVHAALADRLAAREVDGESDDAGALRFDGCPLRDLDHEQLRDELALVRDAELVAGSIVDNLDVRVDARTLRAALELVDLGERVAALPEGLHQRLLPDGAPLRPCEARRLTLARALLRRPRLLVIDGGLDGLGLDDQAFARLLDHLFDPLAPWTLLVISDDPRVLARA